MRPLLVPVLSTALLALLLTRLPGVADPSHIDVAWQALLEHDWSAGARAGVDSIFTYGPLGMLLNPSVVQGEGLALRFVLAYALGLGQAIALVALATRLRGPWRRAWPVALVVLEPFVERGAAFTALAVLGLVALPGVESGTTAIAARPSMRRALAPAAAMLSFVVLGLAKFTYLGQAAATVGIAVLALAATARWRSALAITAAFGTAFAVVWLSIGQRLADASPWLVGSIEIAAGYNDSMGSGKDPAALHGALLLLAVDGALALAGLAITCSRPWCTAANARLLAGTAVVASGLLTTWKAGFVRPDFAHTAMFFAYATATPFLLVAAVGPPRRWSRAWSCAAAAAVALGIVMASRGLALLPPAYTQAWQTAARAAQPLHCFREIEQQLAAQHGLGLLPESRRVVGDGSIDMLGQSQALMFTAGMHVRHRPVLQSYSAYTPYLQQRNADFLAAADGPQFLLVALEPIDGRLPLVEDALAWRVALRRYRPALVESGFVLMQRDESAPAGEVDDMVERLERTAAFDEWVELPARGSSHTVALGVTTSPLGRFLATVYRAEPIRLDVRTEDDAVCTFRVSPQLVCAGFLLDPLLVTPAQLIGLYTGPAPPRVRAFRLRTEAGRRDRYRATFDVAIESSNWYPSPVAEADAELLQGQGRLASWPGFALVPFAREGAPDWRILPPWSGGGVAAPVASTLLCHWPGGRGRLRATFRLAAGNADDAAAGVRVFAAVGANEPRRVLFARSVAASRADVQPDVEVVELDLDLPRDEVVALGTRPIPTGDAEGMRTVWQTISVSSR